MATTQPLLAQCWYSSKNYRPCTSRIATASVASSATAASQAQGSEGMADVMTCPICGLNTKRIDDTEPATYECSDHTYRVEGKVLEDDVLRGKGKMEWRDAYESAKRRAPSGELPIVTSDDFDKASPPPAV